MDKTLSEILASCARPASVAQRPGVSSSSIITTGTVESYDTGAALLPQIANPLQFDTGVPYGKISAATVLISPNDDSEVIAPGSFELQLYGAVDMGTIFSDWTDGEGVTILPAEAYALRAAEVGAIDFASSGFDQEMPGGVYAARQRVVLSDPLTFDFSGSLHPVPKLIGVLRTSAAWSPLAIAQHVAVTLEGAV